MIRTKAKMMADKIAKNHLKETEPNGRLNVIIPKSMIKNIKQLALDKNSSMMALTVEAITDLFKKHNFKP